MKKNILTFIYMIAFMLFIFILQLFVIDSRDLFGVKPNLILIATIVVSVWFDRNIGTGFGFLMGIITDLLFGSTFGGFTIAYTIVAAIIGVIHDKYMKDSKLSLIYITLMATSLFEIIQYIEYAAVYHVYSNVFYLIKQILVASLLNIAIVFVIYTLIYKVVGYFENRLERSSKGF